MLVVGVLFFHVSPPVGPWAALAFLPSVVLGFVVNFSISFITALSLFWTTNWWGVRISKRWVVNLLSGAFVPLVFFPDGVRAIVQALPLTEGGRQRGQLTMRRYLKLYPRFVAQNFQAKVEYKLDFWLGVLGSLLMQVTGLAFIWVVFTRIPDLNGWSFYQVAFIYGLAAIPKALTEFFFDGTWYLGWLIYRGELDRLLVRPLNPLFHLIAEHVETHGLGHLIVGGAILVVSSRQLAIHWDVPRLLYLLLAVVCGSLIYFSVNLLSACIFFWTIGGGSWMMVFYTFSEFAKYPITIYGRLIQAVITWLLPFAFTSFFPATYARL